MKFSVKMLVAAMAAVSLVGCAKIDTGNVGVESTLGQVKQEELNPGVYFTLFKNVDEFTTRELSMSLTDMKAKTKDNVTMADYDIDVYFRTSPSKVADLYLKYQGDAVRDEKTGDGIVAWGRVGRSAREVAYAVASEYDALSMHQYRTELAGKIQKALQAELNKNDPDTFTVTDVNVRALVTDPALEKTIREKVETQNRIDQKQKEIELAKAEATRKAVEAEGEAKANKIIAESLSGNLIRLREIEATARFAGQGTHTVLLGNGDAKPLVNVSK